MWKPWLPWHPSWWHLHFYQPDAPHLQIYSTDILQCLSICHGRSRVEARPQAPDYKNMFQVCRFVIYLQCLSRSRQVLNEFDQAVNRTFYCQKLKQTIVSIWFVQYTACCLYICGVNKNSQKYCSVYCISDGVWGATPIWIYPNDDFISVAPNRKFGYAHIFRFVSFYSSIFTKPERCFILRQIDEWAILQIIILKWILWLFPSALWTPLGNLQFSWDAICYKYCLSSLGFVLVLPHVPRLKPSYVRFQMTLQLRTVDTIACQHGLERLKWEGQEGAIAPRIFGWLLSWLPLFIR